MSRAYRAVAFSAAAAAGLLSGACGNSAPPVPTTQTVYVSTSDCVRIGKHKPEVCDTAVQRAIADYEKTAAKHTSEKECEGKEGTDRCDRVTERHWRPRLMGYLFIANANVVAKPLHAGLAGAPVFRTLDGQVLDPEKNDAVKYTSAAMAKATGFIPQKKNVRQKSS